MRNKILPILTIVFAFIVFQTNGQGFRGKRSTISYSIGFSSVSGTYDLAHILYHNKLNYGYALNKRISLNMVATYCNSKHWKDDNTIYSSLQIHDYTLGLNFSYFFKNQQGFSPLGRYVGFGVEYGKQNLLRQEVVQSNPYYGPHNEYYYDNEATTDLMVFSVFFGRNFLFKEKLVAGYSLQIGYCSGLGPNARQLFKPQFTLGYIF